MNTAKIIFAGTPEFAATSLEALIQDSRFEVICVLTQPDRPSGRGQKLQASPVKLVALANNIPVLQPASLKDAEIQATLKALQADVMIVAAYGLLLPQAVLDIPAKGCINIHGSILPKWRGAAPVQRAIEMGDEQTGITIMQMEKGLDTGPMFYIKTCAIDPDDTAASLMTKLAHLGAEAIVESLPGILNGELHAQVQDNAKASYAKKLEKSEGLLDWQQSATILERKVRALYPWPGCYFEYQNQMIKVGEAEVAPNETKAPAGTLIKKDKDLLIACSQDALRLIKIQIPGGKMLPAEHLAHKFI